MLFLCYKSQMETGYNILIYCESRNLLGSPTVDYLLIDHDGLQISIQRENFSIFGLIYLKFYSFTAIL